MNENVTGIKLRALREGAEYSTEKLARLLNCEPELISSWENCESAPSLEQWLIMCELYCISPDEMFSHINAEDFVDSDVKEEFHHEASMNKLLRRCKLS